MVGSTGWNREMCSRWACRVCFLRTTIITRSSILMLLQQFYESWFTPWKLRGTFVSSKKIHINEFVLTVNYTLLATKKYIETIIPISTLSILSCMSVLSIKFTIPLSWKPLQMMYLLKIIRQKVLRNLYKMLTIIIYRK